ncbi:MAG: hypothetical protein JNM17_08920 [Archangium sp.]|nr:hypothetical protein [Archangium sp.]
MRSRLGLALCMLVVAGCQCFSPVAELDGGTMERDAGRDAGIDAGVINECTTSSQCSNTGVVPPCWSATPPMRSCFDNRCIYDCGSQPRVCTTNNGMCLECDGGLNTCAGGCGIIQPGETGRLYRHCGMGGVSELLGGYTIRYAQGATCNFVISTDAGVSGTLDEHGGDPTSVAQISLEPGVSCSVTTLATALNRTLIGCSQCIYLLESP